MGAWSKARLTASVTGTVTAVRECWWMKVNTKAVRSRGGDGALYPHVLTVCYTVDGQDYRGHCWVNWNRCSPQPGARVTVQYDPEKPKRKNISW